MKKRFLWVKQYLCQVHSEQAIEITQAWSDAHPPKTKRDVLVERFPNAIVDSNDGCPVACAESLGLCSQGECRGYNNCAECWNAPYE